MFTTLCLLLVMFVYVCVLVSLFVVTCLCLLIYVYLLMFTLYVYLLMLFVYVLLGSVWNPVISTGVCIYLFTCSLRIYFESCCLPQDPSTPFRKTQVIVPASYFSYIVMTSYCTCESIYSISNSIRTSPQFAGSCGTSKKSPFTY